MIQSLIKDFCNLRKNIISLQKIKRHEENCIIYSPYLIIVYFVCNEKKFMMTEAARMASIDSLQSLLTDCRNTGDQMSAQIKKLLRDTTQMGNSIRQYQSMLSTNMTEQEKLNALLSQKKTNSAKENAPSTSYRT